MQEFAKKSRFLSLFGYIRHAESPEQVVFSPAKAAISPMYQALCPLRHRDAGGVSCRYRSVWR